jgi:hypothetical protein
METIGRSTGLGRAQSVIGAVMGHGSGQHEFSEGQNGIGQRTRKKAVGDSTGQKPVATFLGHEAIVHPELLLKTQEKLKFLGPFCLPH